MTDAYPACWPKWRLMSLLQESSRKENFRPSKLSCWNWAKFPSAQPRRCSNSSRLLPTSLGHTAVVLLHWSKVFTTSINSRARKRTSPSLGTVTISKSMFQYTVYLSTPNAEIARRTMETSLQELKLVKQMPYDFHKFSLDSEEYKSRKESIKKLFSGTETLFTSFGVHIAHSFRYLLLTFSIVDLWWMVGPQWRFLGERHNRRDAHERWAEGID